MRLAEGTPLHITVMEKNADCFFLLLKHGANLTTPNKYGDTSLSLLCQQASNPAHQKSRNMLKQLLKTNFVTPEMINTCNCLYTSIYQSIDFLPHSKAYKPEQDTVIAELLLEYTADPNPSLLLAAQWHLPLLHVMLTRYNGNYLQKNTQNQTIFYRAFMFQNLNDPHDFAFFKNFNPAQKKAFMVRELFFVANFRPKNILGKIIWGNQDAQEYLNILPRLNSFIETCAKYGNIDLNEVRFFNLALEHTQARQKSFNESARPENWKRCISASTENSKYWCMYKDEEICRRIFDEGHPAHRCSDCNSLFPFNEVIVHAFAKHITPITDEQRVYKQVAFTYRDQPREYYWKKQDEKESIKDIIRKTIESSH